MAEFIEKTDTLNQGRVKLNSAIKDAEDAKNISGEADEKATQALANSESTQTQLDTIVIEGDSSVEAAQARVDADGNIYSTLKERLDTEHGKVTSQLTQNEESINDLGNNVKRFNDIQTAVNERGKTIIPAGVYEIDKPIFLDSNNIEIVGIGEVVIKKSPLFQGDALIKSLREERTNVTGSLTNVIIKNIKIDGVTKDVGGIYLSGFTRGCKIEGVEVENVLDGIRIKDSWSFALESNNINQCEEKGIKLEGAINAITLLNNTIRNSEHGIFGEDVRGSMIMGNTSERNDINFEMSGTGNTVGGNYFELPNEENVILGSTSIPFSSNEFGGNFFNNVGDSQGAIILVNAIDNDFGVNTYVNVIYMYYLTPDSVVEFNEFKIPLGVNTTSFRKDGVSSSYGHFLGGSNRVFRGSNMSDNIPDNGISGSTADWRINTPNQQNWARIGKLSSDSEYFQFAGDSDVIFRFDRHTQFNSHIGFFGETPKAKYTVTGETTEQQLSSLLNALRGYGLVN